MKKKLKFKILSILSFMLLMSFSQNILALPGAGGTTGSGGTVNGAPGTSSSGSGTILNSSQGTTTPPGNSNNMNSSGNTSTDQVKTNQSSTTSPTPTPTPTRTPIGGCINTASQGQLCGTNATTYCKNNSSSSECSNF